MTLREAQTAAATRLAANPALADHASRDADHLILHALSLPRTALFAHPGRLLSPAETAAVEALITRRLTLEPIQYITGHQEFYGLPLHVTPATLIPRPETELLVEAVLARIPRDKPVTILDIGTGSGAIAIALAHNLPQAVIYATDISQAALEIASQNATLNGVEVHFHQSDLLDELPNLTFDVIASNPPYIPTSDRPTLHPQVRDFEPPTALFAGPEGLDIYRRLIPQALKALNPNGLLAIEIGHGQQPAIATLLKNWQEVTFLNDLQHIPRVALARRP